MLRKQRKEVPSPSVTPLFAPPILEPLLGVHSASNLHWVADAASTAAERGLGALYSLLYLTDVPGLLVGQRPGSSERMRALVKVRQALDTDLTALKFDPQEREATAAALLQGRAIAVPELDQALPLQGEAKHLQGAQRRLGVAEVWLAPLHWGGESLGLLVLLMPANPSGALGTGGAAGLPRRRRCQQSAGEGGRPQAGRTGRRPLGVR